MEEQYEEAIGPYIIIDADDMQQLKSALSKPANKNIDVAVSLFGTRKEYTFEDFFARLGFDYENT